VQKTIKGKKECFKCMHLDRNADNVELHKVAKKSTKCAVSEARGQMYGLYYRLGTKEAEDIYKMTKSRERKMRDIKCIKDETELTPNKRRRDQEQVVGVF
jgi:Zn ribbon nucleic-acid-binding protein